MTAACASTATKNTIEATLGFFFLIADAKDPSLSNINSPESPPDPPDVSDPTQTQISLHSLAGHLAPKTLCLFGTISGHSIMILIDGGSTHNLIQDSLVAHLGFSSRETRPLRVMVGNGQHLECKRWCEAVTIGIQSTQFTLDLYILPSPMPMSCLVFSGSSLLDQYSLTITACA